jgi:hypothetical protein
MRQTRDGSDEKKSLMARALPPELAPVVARMLSRVQRQRDQVELANLIPGEGEPSAFHATDYEKTTSEFELFLDQNFPRKKFGELRDKLDRASRSKVITAVQFYNDIAETRRRMRSVAIVLDWVAESENRCPELRLCSVCGRIFAPARKDRRTCTDKCGNRDRQARKRALAKAGEYERKSEQKKADKEYEQKQKKLKAKGAPPK